METPYMPRTIAQWYQHADNAPDAATHAAYRAFVDACCEQFEDMLASGLDVQWQRVNPYANSAEMFADVSAGRLRVLESETAPHACMNASANDIFRAVHDYYGHYLGRNGFGPVGEYRAYLRHAKMFDGPALQAMATETLGQNSWVNFGPFSHLPPSVRPYAAQKAVLFPVSLLPKGGL